MVRKEHAFEGRPYWTLTPLTIPTLFCQSFILEWQELPSSVRILGKSGNLGSIGWSIIEGFVSFMAFHCIYEHNQIYWKMIDNVWGRQHTSLRLLRVSPICCDHFNGGWHCQHGPNELSFRHGSRVPMETRPVAKRKTRLGHCALNELQAEKERDGKRMWRFRRSGHHFWEISWGFYILWIWRYKSGWWFGTFFIFPLIYIYIY